MYLRARVCASGESIEYYSIRREIQLKILQWRRGCID